MKKQKQEQEKCCFKDVTGLFEWRTEQRERNVFVKG
jgi:hypothetical protein